MPVSPVRFRPSAPENVSARQGKMKAPLQTARGFCRLEMVPFLADIRASKPAILRFTANTNGSLNVEIRVIGDGEESERVMDIPALRYCHWFALSVILVLLLAACGSGGQAPATPTATASPASPAASPSPSPSPMSSPSASAASPSPTTAPASPSDSPSGSPLAPQEPGGRRAGDPRLLPGDQ